MGAEEDGHVPHRLPSRLGFITSTMRCHLTHLDASLVPAARAARMLSLPAISGGKRTRPLATPMVRKDPPCLIPSLAILPARWRW